MRYGNVFINTEKHGLKYFNLGTLKKGLMDDEDDIDDLKLICEITDLKDANLSLIHI